MIARIQLILFALCAFCGHLAAIIPTQNPTQPIGILVRTWETSGALPFPVEPPAPFHPLPIPPPSPIAEVNYICAQWDSEEIPDTLPFDVHYPATEIILTQPQHFVRLLGTPQSSPNGAWIMRSEYVRGKTPAELRDIFALPNPPIDINNVEMPASPDPITGKNYVLWTGIAAPIRAPGYDWGDGGAVQNRLVSNYKTAYAAFSTYTFTNEATTRNHRQPIGEIALSYKPLAGNGNLGRVASYLDAFIPKAYSDLENVYHDLDYINYLNFGVTPLRDALYQISPERFNALSFLHFRSALLFSNSLLEKQISRQWKELSSCSCSEEDECACCPQGFTLYGIGEYDKRSGCTYHNTFKSHTCGLICCIDKYARPNLSVGLAIAGIGNHLKWTNFCGTIHGGNAQASAYAEYSRDNFFIDGLLGGGLNWNSTCRGILFNRVDRIANSNQTGGQLELCLQGGLKCITPFMPLARISYIFTRQNHFEEDGANSLNLCVNNFSTHTVRTYLGFEMNEAYETPAGRLLPHLEIAWAEDIHAGNRTLCARLIDRPDSFAICAAPKTEAYFIGGAGLTFELTRCSALSIRYNAEVRSYQTVQIAKIGFNTLF